MSTERDLLWESLPPDEAGWPEFAEAFLGRRVDCPSTGDLIDYGLEQASAELAAVIDRHCPTCRSCDRWIEAFRHGLRQMDPNPNPRSGSMLDVFSSKGKPNDATPPPGALGGPESLVLTGVASMIIEGRTQEALKVLEPILPDVLARVGLEPDLCEQLREFIRHRLEQPDPQHGTTLPDVVKAFGEGLNREVDVPHDPNEWHAILFRGAVKTVLQASKDPTDRAFLQVALDRGLGQAAALDLVRVEQESASTKTVSPAASRRLIRVVGQQQNSLSRLFGVN